MDSHSHIRSKDNRQPPLYFKSQPQPTRTTTHSRNLCSFLQDAAYLVFLSKILVYLWLIFLLAGGPTALCGCRNGWLHVWKYYFWWYWYEYLVCLVRVVEVDFTVLYALYVFGTQVIFKHWWWGWKWIVPCGLPPSWIHCSISW
jgi:hypothetical protein